jgi:thiamine-monophosphate kinase
MRLNDEVEENRRLTRWADLLPRAPGQLGGIHEADAELVPLGDGRLLALTIDTVAEEIRLGLYSDPRTAGRIAATAALSDLAAVGAEPLGLLLSVTLPPENVDAVQEAVARGVAEAVRASGTFVLGGDTNEGPMLSVGCAAAGVVPSEMVIRRVGLRPGDILFAAGPLGLGAACAASALLGSGALLPEQEFVPPSRIAQGVALRGLASAAMDTSDGLVATLDQLGRLNGVRLNVTRSPGDLLHTQAAEVGHRLGLPPLALLAAVHGEFELVFGIPANRRSLLDEVAGKLEWCPIEIGLVEEGLGIVVDGRSIDGAYIRNLLTTCGGDPRVYAQALVAATR